MTYLQFAKKVLENASQPLTPQEIWDSPAGIALRKDFKPAGKTPVASLGACLYTNCKKKDSIILSTGKNPAHFALKKDSEEHFSNEVQTEQIPEANLFSISQDNDAGLSFTECAQKVLERFANNQPMHYRDITKKALEKKWLVTEGKTPENSMYAQIISEIQRRKKKGEIPRFVRHGKGMVSLSCWIKNDLVSQIDAHNKKTAKALKKELFNLKPVLFEKLIEKLLIEMGFENVSLTPPRKDNGVDVRAIMVTGDVIRTKIAVQVKRWKNTIGSPIIQTLRESLDPHEQGVIITTSDFSKDAYKEANGVNRAPIALINGDQLVSILLEYGIGVKKTDATIFEVDEESSILDWLKSGA